MDVYYLHAEPGFIFFFKALPDPDQPAPYPIRTQTIFISACKYREFNNWLKFGRNIVDMYMIIQTQLCPKKCITHLCKHKPQPQYMVMAETSTFGMDIPDLLRGWGEAAVTNDWGIIYSLWCTSHEHLVLSRPPKNILTPNWMSLFFPWITPNWWALWLLSRINYSVNKSVFGINR